MNPGHDEEPQYWAFLEIVDLQGVERLVAPEESGWLHFPTWSPDGRSLAYVTGEQSNTIWVVGHDVGRPGSSVPARRRYKESSIGRPTADG